MKSEKFKLILLSVFIFLFGCTRETIEFGTVPENNYTQLAYVDTVNVQLSSVLTDSFATSGASSLLVGNYNDPILGVVTAKSFLQLDIPDTIPDIPSTAVYDSLVLVVKPNDYYYGDTSRQEEIYVGELSEALQPTYANSLYNTSNFDIEPVPLGTKTFFVRPVADDSIVIRLTDSKGAELYSKIKGKSADLSNTESFQNYFRGISLYAASNNTAAVFGLLSGSGNVAMRLYYHHTLPYKEEHYVDFLPSENSLAFNQILAYRSGTGITSGVNGITEIPSSLTNNYSFSQPGTGLQLKVGFPSLKGIQFTDNYVKLLKAELILKPAHLSFDNNLKLPDSLYLVYTDKSNIAGTEMADSTGSAVMYAKPVIDNVYGENTYYRFNITPYINQLLSLQTIDNYGLYVMQKFSETSPHVSRLILQNTGHDNYSSELHLSLFIVNK